MISFRPLPILTLLALVLLVRLTPSEAGAAYVIPAWIGAATAIVEPAGDPVSKNVPPYAPLTAEASELEMVSIEFR